MTDPENPPVFLHQLRRRRESITAEEVIARLSRTPAEFTAERIFAIGLIELAIAQIQEGL